MFQYWLGVATLVCIYLIAMLGVSILVGFTGIFSLGHAGLMAIGAYLTAIMEKSYGLPFGIALIVGMLGAAAVGGIIGKLTLKLKGDYFVIATLAIGECTKLVIENLQSITGGSRGLSDVPKTTSFPLAFIILVITVILLANFLKSKHGRNCVAVREEELAARSVGINTTNYKMLAFIISCLLCGLSGGLLAGYMGFLYPTMFTMAKSNELIITVILGGAGSLTGTIIAGLVLIPLPEFLRIPSVEEWRMVAYGLLVVIVVVFRPSGLMGQKELTVAGLLKRISKMREKRMIANNGSTGNDPGEITAVSEERSAITGDTSDEG